MRSFRAIAALAVLLAVPLACEDDESSLFEQRAVDVFVNDMQYDLTRWVTAEGVYKAASGSYTVDPVALTALQTPWPSYGVTVTVMYASSTSAGATATHTMTSRKCAVFVGTPPVTPLLAGVTLTSGQPGCEP